MGAHTLHDKVHSRPTVFAARSLAAVLSLAGLVHCGSSGASAPDAGDSAKNDTQPGVGGAADASPRASADAGNMSPGASDMTADSSASGMILVHASANLPALRLCFGNSGVAGNLLPLPDSALMPQSNVVGVDVGSAVRYKPLSDVGLTLASNGGAPHTVYAIPEKYLRPPLRPANTPCSALICPGLGGDCLDATQFTVLGTAPAAAYQPGVHALVVTGCAPGSGDATSCGTGFDLTGGNAHLMSIELSAYTPGNADDLLVQYIDLSPALTGQAIGVTFGDLSAKGTTSKVTAALGTVTPAQPLKLTFDRTDPQVYASHGFHLDAAGLSFDQSLATIQELSAPEMLPADFYAVRSNFAMFLLGNPAVTAPDGGPVTAATDPGSVLHLIGVAVGQPVEDAGAADAGPYEAGPRDASSDVVDAGGPG